MNEEDACHAWMFCHWLTYKKNVRFTRYEWNKVPASVLKAEYKAKHPEMWIRYLVELRLEVTSREELSAYSAKGDPLYTE